MSEIELAATAIPGSEEALLVVDSVTARYQSNTVLHGVSLTVPQKCIVTLLGHNGAGKTTLCRVIFGLHPTREGTVRYAGESMPSAQPLPRVRAGMAYVPQGTNIFPSLTIEENLDVSLTTSGVKDGAEERKAFAFQIFPMLKERPHHRAGALSGGQRQMLAVSLALVKRPRLLILDEPSLGIAPNLVQRLMENLITIRDTLDTSILLIDQAARSALRVADHAYVMKMGKIIADAPATELAAQKDLWQYF